ncbi:hypothetical protein [Rhodanobacter caeni]|uniref:Secreted protein n=1 Tax=Rhodanobacter caeni TaxID=657654 RepID=A0ABP3E7M4_9GAMM
MNVKHWFIGCVVGLAGVSATLTVHADQADPAASAHMSPDRASRIVADTDGACPARECPTTDEAAGDANRTDTRSNRSGGGSATPPTSNRRSHLGWQSLLPGSIQ